MSSIEFDNKWATAAIAKEKMAGIKAGEQEDPKAPLFREIAELRKALQDFAAPLPLATLTSHETAIRQQKMTDDEISQAIKRVADFKIRLRELLSQLLSGEEDTAGEPSAADLDAVAEEQKTAEATSGAVQE